MGRLDDHRAMWNNPTEENVMAYAEKYMSEEAQQLKPKRMVAGVHKARIRKNENEQHVLESYQWLAENGFRPPREIL